MSEVARALDTKPLRRFRPYPAYKDSGVEWLGKIPAHWEVKRAKLIFREVDRRSSAGEETLLGLTRARGVVLRDEIEQRASVAATYEGYKICEIGDLVLNKLQAWNGVIGVSNYHGLVSPDYTVFRAIADTDLRFCAYLFRSPLYISEFSSRSKGIGSGFLRLYTEDFGLVPFLAPQVPEQRAIAAFLDRETARIDALVAKKERLITLLQEQRIALITRAVTKGLDPTVPMKDSGVEWLGEIPAHWEAKRLRNVVDWIEQGWSPDCESRQAADDEWGVLKAGCVNRGRFIEEEHKALPAHLKPLEDLEVHAGDLLMSRASGSRDLVGSAAVVPRCRPRLLLCDKVFRLHVATDTHRPFLAYALNSRIARWQIELALSGGNGLANNIAQGVVKDLLVVAPSFDEQLAIAAFLDRETARFDALIAKVRDAIDCLKELRTALISAAVTGKIDVREEAA